MAHSQSKNRDGELIGMVGWALLISGTIGILWSLMYAVPGIIRITAIAAACAGCVVNVIGFVFARRRS